MVSHAFLDQSHGELDSHLGFARVDQALAVPLFGRGVVDDDFEPRCVTSQRGPGPLLGWRRDFGAALDGLPFTSAGLTAVLTSCDILKILPLAGSLTAPDVVKYLRQAPGGASGQSSEAKEPAAPVA